ncbi:MAG: lycopene cyclase domain-containing protein [Candidatus Gracilibacteria bacterium]|nr:lycopene cyclase domain-containing protein [Candidatus Gracilibacteria bacterium]
MAIKYLYLIGSLYFFIISIIMYLLMPKYRKPMLLLGLTISLAGPLSEYIWMTKDWWHPETITNTIIGIEDFIFSFAHIIIPMFIYKLIFKKDTNKDFKKENINMKFFSINLILWFLIPFSLSGILFSIFKINSIISVNIGMTIACVIMIIKRKDLFIPAFLTGFILLIIAIPAYTILYILNSDYVNQIWYMQKLSGILFLEIPIEDIIRYWIYGFMMGGAYEFLFDFKLIEKK